MIARTWTRRDILRGAAATGISTIPALAEERRMIDRPIPASGERLPVIGLGTYSVFDVPSTTEEIARRKEIVDLLLGEGSDGYGILVYPGDGDGSFEVTPLSFPDAIGPGGFHVSVLADLNGDGADDIAICGDNESVLDGEVLVYLSTELR